MSTTFIPWNSIAEGMVRRDREPVAHAQALESPCLRCTTSPCCSHLPLHTFTVGSLMELDHARYLLNFDHLELGIAASGEWTAYYRYPCRHLDRTDFTCTVHGTAEQPDVCAHYNPYQCWYRRVLTAPVTDEFVRVDRQRLEFLLPSFRFDDDGRIVETATWEQIVEGLAALPLEPAAPGPEAPGPDPAAIAWREGGPPVPAVDRGYADLADPCTGCAAHCCTAVVFPHPVPATRAALDFVRFCLGFPGIEVGIADDTWSLIVRTRCRHLVGTRCGVYGTPDRPLLCGYYDAARCSYRLHFGRSRPPGHLRVTLAEFPAVAECFRFDELGDTVLLLPADDIREHIEAGWRAGV